MKSISDILTESIDVNKILENIEESSLELSSYQPYSEGAKMTIQEFFGTLLAASEQVHKSHLKTKKYAGHIAMNEFYDDIVDKVDALIEAYQGLNGIVDDYKNTLTCDSDDCIKYLEDLLKLTRDGRKQYCTESELESLCDDILTLIDSTLYKLKNLTENKVALVDYIKESIL